MTGTTHTPAAGAQPIARHAIPRTDETIPVIGLGTWQTFDVGAAESARAPLRDVLTRFVECGGSVIDSSPMYGRAESVVGDLAADLGIQDKLFYATKVWTSGQNEGVRQMQESFRRMRVQRMDLMQIHNLLDLRAHTQTLLKWKREGRVRYIGITHYHAGAHAELERLVRTKTYDFMQINYSLGEREAEGRLLPAAQEAGVAVLVNRPFGSGGLFRRVRGEPLPGWAPEIGCTSWAQIMLKWIVSHPAVTCAIPATSNPRHVIDNMAAGLGPQPDARMRRSMADAFDKL
ncbi:MAG: aldo/keto reductase [Betaproteobacteria bacterium]|nr:aldo/keto reductase [Betaproteobacteria bacterium]